MPEPWLPVPHRQQADKATCLAACARMVLAFYHDERSEQELVDLLRIAPSFGAPGSRLLNLSQLGYHVAYDTSSLALLQYHLAQRHPPIVLLKTGWLTYWDQDVAHACVLAGILEETVFLFDPYFPSGPREVTLTEFLAGWTEMDFLTAIVTR